jgi:O-antigen/teichoic acid export membrane protein
MPQKRTLLNDGVWVSATQVLTALGQLLGVRLLTEWLSPGVFGQMNLWLGIVALVSASLANPTMQAILRFYPEFQKQGNAGVVRILARQQILKMAAWLSPLLIMVWVIAIYKQWASWLMTLVIVALISIEIVRVQNTAVLSAIRSQRAYGAWLVLESWLRPMAGVVAVYLLGEQAVWVLLAYCLASTGIWLLMRRFMPELEVVEIAQNLANSKAEFWQYTLPLLPLGIFGWLSGMADRYIINGVMTAADVGLYVAAYGLASRPVLMLGGIIETTIRPVYQQAVISGDAEAQQRHLQQWKWLLAIGCMAGLIISIVAHQWIAWLLLGAEFRSGSYLIPWLVAAHIFLILAQWKGRMLLVHSKTVSLAKVEISATLLALMLSVVLTLQFGLIGAAIAVIAGYMFQYAVASYFVRKAAIIR